MNESTIDIRPNFVKIASPKHQHLWESLNEQQRQMMENQASLRDLDTQEKVDRFFESRVFPTVMPGQHISRQSQQPTASPKESHPLVESVISAMRTLNS